MRNKFKKLAVLKIIVITSMFFVFAGYSDNSASAAYSGAGKFSILKCMQNSANYMPPNLTPAEKTAWQSGFTNMIKTFGSNFVSFLTVFISWDGFMEDTIEPWGDVILSNQCQALDLLNLVEKRDAIERSILNSYLTCKLNNFQAAITDLNRTNAEIYYVRHVVNRKAGNLPIGLRSLTDGASTIRDSAGFYQEMKKRYVPNPYRTEVEFKKIYAGFDVKYKERKKDYSMCPSSAWNDVVEKAKEFSEYFQKIGKDFAFWKKDSMLYKRAKQKIVDPVVSIYKNPVGFLMSKVELDASVNGGVDFSNPTTDEGYQQLLKQLQEEAGPHVLTQAEILGAVSTKSKTFDIQKTAQELNNKFISLYYMSDNSTQSFVAELDKLDKTINQGFNAIDQVKQCGDDINKK